MKKISHYRIFEKIGEGGMGEVYRAEDTNLKRSVALKFLSKSATGTQDDKARFFREAQAAAALDHSNICAVYEIDEAEGQAFIAMPYVQGNNLKEKIRAGKISLQEVIDIAIQLADGLSVAHKEGIVHRDIKSTNIMITPEGQVKIMDFGLAKSAEMTQITSTGARVGTLAYSAPEQLYGGQVDHRADIWSLGVVIYEMIAGRLPFKGKTIHSVMYSCVSSDPPTPDKFRPEVPRKLIKIIEKTLEKNPMRRYQTAKEITSDLKLVRAQIHTETTKKIPAYLQFIRTRFAGRYRILTIAIAILLIMLFSIAIFEPVKRFLGASSVPDKKHLAVFPLKLITPNQQEQTIHLGLSECIAQKLARLQKEQTNFWIVSPDDLSNYNVEDLKGARKIFGATLALTGEMAQNGDNIHLALELINTETNKPIKETGITDHIANLATFQEGIPAKISEMLEIPLTREKLAELNTGNTALPGAYILYLRGLGHLSPKHYLNLGGEEKLNRVDRAIELFKEAIRQDSMYSLAYAGLGEALRRKHNLTKEERFAEEAKAACRESIRLTPDLAKPHFALGLLFEKTGKYKEAIAEFKKTIETDIACYQAYIELALCYESTGNLKEAEQTYVKATEVRPSYWLGYYNLGTFFNIYGRNTEAEKALHTATELVPENNWNYTALIGVYYFLKKPDLSEEMFKKSITCNPTTIAYSNMGTIHFYGKQYADAMKLYEKAIEMGTNRIEIWGNLGDTYRFVPSNEHNKKAIEAYSHAIELGTKQLKNRDNSQLRASIALYYAKSGKKENSLAYITHALKSSPSNTEIVRKSILVYEIGGMRNDAIRMLKEYIKRYGSIKEIASDPYLNYLRHDPRYKEIIPK